MPVRQWKYEITAGDEGKSLGEILRAAGFSKKEISRQKFIPDGITLDGRKCRVSEGVRAGQTVVLHFREEQGGESPDHSSADDFGRAVLWEDDCLLVVNKPSGLSCHPGPGHYCDNLGTLAQAWCRGRGEAFPVRQIGRLDKDTSGIVVFAKDKVTAARLWRQRSRGELSKTYYAAVHGRLPQQEGIVDIGIRKAEGEKNKMQACPEGMEAVTCYRVLGETVFGGETVSLIECTLKTGRTHQIRVHMASLGNPLLGDPIYGVADRAGRLCLHAGRIRLRHPFTGEPLELHAKACPGIPGLAFAGERMRCDGTGEDNLSY